MANKAHKQGRPAVLTCKGQEIDKMSFSFVAVPVVNSHYH